MSKLSIIMSYWSTFVQMVMADKIRAAKYAASLIMFLAYLMIPLSAPQTFISPDETVNFYFARSVAETGSLWYVDPLNIDAYDRIHPRATESHGGLVTPSLWWGMSLLAGLLGNLTHPMLMHALTAMVAVLAVWCFSETIKEIFDEKTSTYSFFLLLLHPAWWYYASRGWHHNILFVSLLMMVAFIMVKKPWADTVVQGLFSGGLFFLAVLMRPTELLWIISALGLAWVLMPLERKTISVMMAVGAMTAVCFALIRLYVFEGSADFTPVSTTASNSELVWNNFFPNGFSLKTVARSVLYYGVVKTWWISLFMVVGVYMHVRNNSFDWKSFFERKRQMFGKRITLRSPFAFGPHVRQQFLSSASDKKNEVIYGYITCLITSILFLWYGSWVIIDNPDQANISLANSYMRYWLPVFVLWTPFIAGGFMRVCELFSFRWSTSVLWCMMVLLSSYMVFGGKDGVFSMVAQLRVNDAIRIDVLKQVPADGIIMTNRHDKLFFPDRRVMFPIDHPGTFESMQSLKNKIPLFIYGLRMDDDELSQYNEVLAQMGLVAMPLKDYGNEELYAVSTL